MTTPSTLQPLALDPAHARLSALEADVARRERELDASKQELLRLQRKYLDEVGALYARLSEVEAALVDAEVRAGLRRPFDADETCEAGAYRDGATEESHGCNNRSAPSDDLKRVFRDVAKAIHPDL